MALKTSLSFFVTLASFSYAFPDCTQPPLKGNTVCDTSKDAITRAKAIVSKFKDDELMANTVNLSPGVPRSALPPYQWWSEALHGVAGAPGETSAATSFPQPITMGAAFDDKLINDIAAIISTETPNINPFKNPRWGRGQETPGEDPFHISQYVYSLVTGLQGGIDPKPYYKIVADCKHYAAYDLENWKDVHRGTFDARVTLQDMSEYYLAPLQTCVRDAKVASVIETGWVTADCDAVDTIISTHNFTSNYPQAAADAIKAGTDVDCGTTYSDQLPEALKQSLITRAGLERALIRQYSSLVRLGYFDPAEKQPYRQISWTNVNTPPAKALAYKAALEGIVLLKNDGTLPFKSNIKSIAFVGTNLTGTSTAGFAAALAAARAADAIVFAGGIDGTIEQEALDRIEITWPGVQLDLVSQLSKLGKPLVVMQFGGGQVDSTVLKNSKQVNAIIWGGYPGQSGGTALADIISGKAAPSADYVNQVPMTDMSLRPSATSPGRTYMWYKGTPVFEFGLGLHYTTFALSWGKQPRDRYPAPPGLGPHPASDKKLDLNTFDTFEVVVKNTGKVASDYAALLFVSGNAGPAPSPNKRLISYTRLHDIKAGSQQTASLKVTLGSIACADKDGNLWVYPGTYKLTVDIGAEQSLSHSFVVEGQASQISSWPKED
ncbi:glycoside hydrolase family 3 protein [Panaeolus papilionaceus]|nr:glycoside hydrolase family 3 protein [Panaeolus papilionaceus]